jgi:tRNA 5-methylaminomethyl-2-thiouridine biosynthesis bifunctional protein
VVDAQDAVAAGGSGQPAGLLHGVVHALDSPHTRWFRAAAQRAHAVIAPLCADGAVRGALDGVLRIERALDRHAMQRLLDAQALPSNYVQALSQAEASARAGCALSGDAWFYLGGGWVDARSLVHHWLRHPRIELALRTRIARIVRTADTHWRLFDADGRAIADAGTLVLANADGLQELLHEPRWPLLRSRGQVTTISGAPAHWRPALPVAGDGYAIALHDGALLCGATSDLDDDSAALRDADHRRNLAALQRLSGHAWDLPLAALDGRVAWRVHTRDRLPLLGGVPLPPSARSAWSRQDQPRAISREPGLHVLAALGSRGLTQAALAGEVVAAMITGTPLPIGASLLDAVDAARFAARDARVAASSTQ